MLKKNKEEEMKKITGSIIINKPIDVVTELFLDPSNLKEYQDGFVKKRIEKRTRWGRRVRFNFIL